MAGMRELLERIAKENPYTDGNVDDMDACLLPPIRANDVASQIDIEMDGRYPGTWDFKGQPQKLNKVLRIKYRYKVKDTGNPGRWMTAYLLIGFEDGSV